ncbi:hypothetical protein SARC_01207 [Sphaeroforma arctica JP610]|uniref:Serine carboxypeptidase S28 n=1 Tax=Sphaeroforma arctica JP610 TaxID=667725 RepID=A0A0L0GCD8_9EUKA|nr:hypothetical protein SARC_01207 [Sphaeroforma arctica JP610]KNC86670.1 hypothetical protein SARC_01207 [Sphaeroforma arctica JP610]|eukprot:XP_014160572.1 hypothetical protein SARC_01207 [Sphaeroforma arctica JP610]
MLTTGVCIRPSTHQAQEDLARFLDYFVHHNELGYDMSETKWIVFGGSYAGAMAAWMKEKYPFLISGSVSSSGPVQAQLNFPEYMDVVTTSMRNLGGDECIAALEDALKTVHDQSQTSQGWEWLGAKFNTCTPIRDEKDLSVFQSSLTGQFSNSVQYNHQINKIPAEDLCSQMTTNTSAIDQLVQIIHISTKGKCVDASWKDSIDVLKEEAFDGQAAARQWQYQTCNEFGYFQSTEGVQADNPFRWLQAMTLDLSGPAVCREVFGIAGPNIDETNRYYGGKDVITANVTYVNAKIDPWHILGVIESTSALDGQEGNEVLLLEGGSHCADMRIIPKYDTDELKNVRERIAANVHKYLH